MKIVIWVLAGVFLLIGSIWDIKELALPQWLLRLGMLGALFGAGYMIISGEWLWWNALAALLPGVLSFLISLATREQLGYGDGWVLCILGGALGAEKVFGIWLGGLLASSIVSIILLGTRRAGKSTRLPFVPFLFLGYLAVSIGGL